LALAAAVAAIALGATAPSVTFAAGADPGPPLAEQAAPSQLKLLVLPFASVANADRDAWIGRAISEALTADLSIDHTLSVTTDKNRPVDAANDALAAGKQAGAQSVVYGTFQNVGENVRVTGQILDVESGKPVAGITATGPIQELFSLQDSLVHQIEIRLGRPGLPAPPPQPAPADSPLPLPQVNNSDGVLGIPKAAERRGIPWLDEENARSDQFLRDVRTAHDDYFNNYPSPAYYGPIYYAPVWGFPVSGWNGGVPFGWGGGAPVGAVPFAPGAPLPGGWRPATPYNPYNYYYPQYYYPPFTTSVTTSDGDGWNGRVQTQGNGIVGGGMRATPKFQPYQLGGGTQYYRQSNGVLGATPQSNAPAGAVTHQVGNRVMPVTSLPESPEVIARRAAAAAPAAAPSGPPIRINRPASPAPARTTPVTNSQQQTQQTSQQGQTARR